MLKLKVKSVILIQPTNPVSIEYKNFFGKKVVNILVAFANIDGGQVIVGVDDKGVVCGAVVGAETIQR